MSTEKKNDKSNLLSEYLRELGSKGGKATAKNRTAAERKEQARKAARARWGRKEKA
jgi:hypothetical protein